MGKASQPEVKRSPHPEAAFLQLQREYRRFMMELGAELGADKAKKVAKAFSTFSTWDHLEPPGSWWRLLKKNSVAKAAKAKVLVGPRAERTQRKQAAETQENM